MTARAGRELAAALLLCAAGAGLALFAGSRPWLRLAGERPPPLPDVSLALTGGGLAPLVPGLAMVGLAGGVALLAAGRRGRVVVGALLAAAGAGLAVRALTLLAAPDPDRARQLLADAGRAGGLAPDAPVTASVPPVWPLLAAAAGLALLAGGLGAVLRARTWPGLSSRYDAPRRRADPDPAAADAGGAAGRAAGGTADGAAERRAASMWDELDRGGDPTAR